MSIRTKLTGSFLAYRRLFENAKDSIITYDLDWNVTDMNREAELSWGYSREELIGRQSMVLLTPDSARLVKERTYIWLSGKKIPSVIEIEGVRKDGSTAFFDARTQFIEDEDGNRIGYQGIFRDVTEKRKADEARVRWAEETSVIAEIGRIVSSSLDMDEVYLRIVREVAKLIQFDRLSISLIDQDRETAVISFLTGIEIPKSPVGRIFPLSESSSVHVIRTKTTQLILPQSEQELAESVPVMSILYRAGLKSFIVVPLQSQ